MTSHVLQSDALEELMVYMDQEFSGRRELILQEMKCPVCEVKFKTRWGQ